MIRASNLELGGSGVRFSTGARTFFWAFWYWFLLLQNWSEESKSYQFPLTKERVSTEYNWDHITVSNTSTPLLSQCLGLFSMHCLLQKLTKGVGKLKRMKSKYPMTYKLKLYNGLRFEVKWIHLTMKPFLKSRTCGNMAVWTTGSQSVTPFATLKCVQSIEKAKTECSCYRQHV